jgi:type III secretion system YscC/HrcC family outer membrane pore protein
MNLAKIGISYLLLALLFSAQALQVMTAGEPGQIEDIDWPGTGSAINLKKPDGMTRDWNVGELLAKLSSATQLKFKLTLRTKIFNLGISSKEEKVEPIELFKTICQQVSTLTKQPIQWIYDGTSKTVELYQAHEENTDKVTLASLQHRETLLAALALTLRASGTVSPNKLSSPPAGKPEEIKGPPLWVEKVKELAKILEPAKPPESDPEKRMMVFDLKYASADGSKLGLSRLGVCKDPKTENMAEIDVKGVAERLNTLLDYKAPVGNDKGTPYFIADKRRNAVMIYDVAAMNANYMKLVEKLDQPQEMVEISASIIDLSESSGLEWESRFSIEGIEKIESRQVPFASGFGASSPMFGDAGITDLLPPASLVSATASGLNAAAMLRGSNYKIINHIRLLESEGQAKIHSRPSILTISNFPAQLADTTSQFITVAGERQSQLYDIKLGLEMVVLPRIMPAQEKKNRQIHLLIDVGDGQAGSLTGDNTATIVNATNRITTQAVLTDGQSLLIGGRYINSQEESTKEVPFLGKIPLIGLAFKNKTVRNAKLQRLYLITPRIVNLGDISSQQREASATMEALAPSRGDSVPISPQSSKEPRALKARIVPE